MPSNPEQGSRILVGPRGRQILSRQPKILSWQSVVVVSVLPSGAGPVTDLERDMVVSDSDFQLLSTVFVLLWPLGIIFPIWG